MQNNENKEVIINEVTQEIDQDRYHPCPACEYCTRERIPDRCTCFRQCAKYRNWLRMTWEMVIEPLRRVKQELTQKVNEKKTVLCDGVRG